MKKISYFILTLLLGLFYSCGDNVEYLTYKINDPVLMDAAEFRNSVKVSDAKPISKQGKICFYNEYLYISSPEKGIHIIDNRDPASPQNIGFIELLGNVDISVKDNMLYADSYIDLVWFDIADPANPKLKERLNNAFPYALPNYDNSYGYNYNAVHAQTDKVVVGWKLVEKKEKVVEGTYMDYASGGGGENSIGKTGSLSRFAIYKDFLYAVNNNLLYIIDIQSASTAVAKEPVHVGWNAETIFSYKDYMFFGTPTGMLIYSVANPLKPEFQSSLQHVYGCDPVVVENDLAYVTIWSGNACGQAANELFIVDVSDVKNPKQIVSYTMTSPKGLGIDNGILFVCDEGLKVFDAKDPQKIMSNVLAHHEGMVGYDVIPLDNVLMVIAEDGLYQYDYSNLSDIKLLSKLAF